MNTAIYHDTAAPTLAVGKILFSVAESEKYVSNNFSALKNQLQRTLNLVPQWKIDLIKSGAQLGEPVLNETWKPLPWAIVRIVTHPTGFQSLFLECKKSEFYSDKLTVQSNDLDGAFVESFDTYVTERMQATADMMISDNESFKRSEESKGKAKRASDLIKAKNVLKRDADMSENMRAAYHTDPSYMGTLEGAAALIAAQGKAKPSGKPTKPTNQAEHQSHAMRMMGRI